jgi:branched-chain amino acid transport system ATP-binding protein
MRHFPVSLVHPKANPISVCVSQGCQRRDLLATCRALAQAGQTILVVEQNISAAMTLADRVYIINNGHIVESLGAAAVREQPEVLHRHLGI